MHLCPEPTCLDYCACQGDTWQTMHPAPADCQHQCRGVGAKEDASTEQERIFARAMGAFIRICNAVNHIADCAAELPPGVMQVGLKKVVKQLDGMIDCIVDLILLDDPAATQVVFEGLVNTLKVGETR